jgi:glycosyltransferase involved in cell wall biosynthesis
MNIGEELKTEHVESTSGSKPLRVAVVTNILPVYRQGFYDRLFSREDIVATVYCQPSLPGMNVRVIHERYPGRVRLLRTLSANAEAIVWQFTPWRALLFGYDVVFVDGNPRILSHVVLATLLRLFRRNVVLWTMAHSYRGQKFTERIRLLWTRVFKYLLVYTDAEVRYLRQLGFTKHDISAMNNGLDQSRIDEIIARWSTAQLEEWRRSKHLASRTVLLSCARLDPKNRFDQVVAALPDIVRCIPDLMWCVIGSGTEAARLRSLVNDADLHDHVLFVGELHEEHDLAPWFLSAAAFVHPAAIGLSLLHAFGYGLPVITHDNAEHHGPEFAAFHDGLSGRVFREDNPISLAASVIALMRDPSALRSKGQYGQRVVRTDYNADVMVQRFVAAAKGATKTMKNDAS